MQTGNAILFKTSSIESYKIVADFLSKHDYNRVLRGVYTSSKNTVNTIISIQDLIKQNPQLTESNLLLFKMLRIEESSDLKQLFNSKI